MSEETFALIAITFLMALGCGIGLFFAYIEPIERLMAKMKKRRAKPA